MIGHGPSPEKRQEVAQPLVKRIVVDPAETTPRKKQATLIMEYAFLVPTATVKRASRNYDRARRVVVV